MPAIICNKCGTRELNENDAIVFIPGNCLSNKRRKNRIGRYENASFLCVGVATTAAAYCPSQSTSGANLKNYKKNNNWSKLLRLTRLFALAAFYCCRQCFAFKSSLFSFQPFIVYVSNWSRFAFEHNVVMVFSLHNSFAFGDSISSDCLKMFFFSSPRAFQRFLNETDSVKVSLCTLSRREEIAEIHGKVTSNSISTAS